MKECTICRETKSLDEFYSQKKTKKDGTLYLYYNPECKECTKKKSSLRIKNNPEKHREACRKNNKTPKRRKEFKERARKNREKGYFGEYYKNNKEKFQEYNLKRRTNKEHEITKYEWAYCKTYFNHSCAYCGLPFNKHKEIYKQDLHREHVDPSGSNKIDNCIPSCQPCNSSKNTRIIDDWYNEDNDNFSKERLEKIHRWLNGDYKLSAKENN